MALAKLTGVTLPLAPIVWLGDALVVSCVSVCCGGVSTERRFLRKMLDLLLS